jgi:hypothetical protein
MAHMDTGHVVSGIPKSVLQVLGQLSLDEIEAIANEMSVSLINFRLNETEINRLRALPDDKKAAYMLAVTTHKRNHGGNQRT